jgi:cell division protein FtsB
MVFHKRYIVRILFAGEVILFLGFYFFGTNGIMDMLHMKSDICAIEKEVMLLTGEVDRLRSHIALQKSHPFFKEKIAREQLQMARADEEIYLV